MKRETIFSPDRVYRYTLWREWDELLNQSYCMFIGLNPSTADEVNDDPTIRRCIQFAKDWGYGAMCMTNAFAFRETNPKLMMKHPAPVGPDNDLWLSKIAQDAGVVVAAWGCDGAHKERDKQVRALIPQLKCLKTTKGGHPNHPLYLPKNLTPIPFL